MAGTVSVIMNHLNDTKGTYRYLEDGVKDQYDPNGKIGVLYIRKATFPHKAPARLKVDVTVLD